MGINTGDGQLGQDQPLYVWYGTGDQVSWPTLLRLWGAEVSRVQPGAGEFVCEILLQLADQAATWNLYTPELHARYRAEELDAEAAYRAALERDAAWDPGDEPEDLIDPQCPDIFGSLLCNDDSPQRAWLSQDPDDETRVN